MKNTNYELLKELLGESYRFNIAQSKYMAEEYIYLTVNDTQFVIFAEENNTLEISYIDEEALECVEHICNTPEEIIEILDNMR